MYENDTSQLQFQIQVSFINLNNNNEQSGWETLVFSILLIHYIGLAYFQQPIPAMKLNAAEL